MRWALLFLRGRPAPGPQVASIANRDIGAPSLPQRVPPQRSLACREPERTRERGAPRSVRPVEQYVLSYSPMSSLATTLETAARFGGGEDGGVTRFAWSPELFEVYEWLAGELRELGLEVEQDASGNLLA